jgi:hypothetical protein
LTLNTIANLLRKSSVIGARGCWEMHKTLTIDLLSVLKIEEMCVSVLMGKINAFFAECEEMTSESEFTPRQVKKRKI